MKKRSFTRLRAHRLRWGLSAADLARLAGRDPSRASKLEAGDAPSLSFVLACEVVFGASARELFPTLYEQIEEQVMQRAVRLLEALEERPYERKRALLDDMMQRATDSGAHA
jgi:transcriptional regulator with XRE-family HTH domain